MVLKDLPSLSLNLNVPGYPKSNENVKTFFRYCLYDLHTYFKAHQVYLNDRDAVERADEAGDFFITTCLSGLHSIEGIKQICEDFEEMHPLGRFIDVDLADREGNLVSSGKAKLCFYCNQRPAVECRRENAHEMNELRVFMFSRMEAYCSQRREDDICRQLSSMALKSILHEIALTPKPGLVDKLSNGSHTDMSFLTFMDSSAAISGWFADLVHAGFAFRDNDLTKALPVVRNIGLQMEMAMFETTHKVNSQKGIIFLIGLSLFASGYLFAGGDYFDIKKFREIMKGICKGLIKRELESQNNLAKSHGEEMYSRHVAFGARGEAENGFPMVFDFGLQVLLSCHEMNDEALVKTFLSIAAQNDDTNILYRSNPGILKKFKSLCFNVLKGFNWDKYNTIVDYCIKENISPGGSADLLAVTIFIYSVIKQSEEHRFVNPKKANQ
jgi:holo-ACP synthase / triphosphoribosyl-dephospho-CoA synthase